MEGEPISQLNQGIRQIAKSFRSFREQTLRLEIATVTFGGVVNISGPVPSADYSFEDLNAAGSTPFGEALSDTLMMLKMWTSQKRATSATFFPPWVITITDGEPTDEWEQTASQLVKEESRGSVNTIPVGVIGANMDKLAKISRRNAPADLRELRFQELFGWLSFSIQLASRAPNVADFTLPPITSWGGGQIPVLVRMSPVQRFILSPPIQEEMSADYLSSQIMPVLSALETIQVCVTEASVGLASNPRLHSVTQRSPIRVSFEGIENVLRAVLDLVVPWRRQHHQAILEYEIKRKDLELKEAKLKLKHEHMRHEHENSRVLLDLEKEREALASLKIANEKQAIELHKEKLVLTTSVIENLVPELQHTARSDLAARLLPHMDTLATSVLEIEESSEEAPPE